VRAEVHRREREAAHVMQETTQARQVQDYLGGLQQQFAPALQAEGVDVLTASANLMQLSSRLRFGTGHEKAQLAAQIIHNYGVDVNALADAIDAMRSGQAPQQFAPQQQPQEFRDSRLDQLLEAQQARILERATSEVDKFGNGKEFFDDVREDMADILDLYTKRGIDIPLEQAYERACRLHPEIGKVLAARDQAVKAGNLNGSTQRARAAASSVRGTPAAVSTSAPSTLRGQIEAAMDAVGGG
jgi:hypothetical protein